MARKERICVPVTGIGVRVCVCVGVDVGVGGKHYVRELIALL